MDQVALFKDFLEAVNAHNKRTGSLIVNSLFVADDAKQRSKMTAEFYNSVRQEIGLYMEKLENFIANGGSSPAVRDKLGQCAGGQEA